MYHTARTLIATALALGFASTALAADVVVELGSGDSFVIKDSGAVERLAVDESGDVSKDGTLFLHDDGAYSTFIGKIAGASSSGVANSAFGYKALYANDSGNLNSAFGSWALEMNTTASGNSAFGYFSLKLNTGGGQNSAFGAYALSKNTTSRNSAFGYHSLQANTTGMHNSAFGYESLNSVSTGTQNSAFGAFALGEATGNDSSAFGYNALANNTSGTQNVAVGSYALDEAGTWGNSTAVGYNALGAVTAGSYSVAVGADAGSGLTSGSRNIFMGRLAGQYLTSGDDNIYIGNGGNSSEDGQIRIGNSTDHTDAFIAGIDGNVVTGTAVLVTSSGELGVAASSIRFKEAVRDMGEASRALMKMRPVTFRYREEVDDGEKIEQYGLIAEEVAEIAPGLVVFDEEGEPFAVRYQFLAPMLLNEVQEQKRVIDEQRGTIAALAGRLERLESRLGSEREGSNR